MEFDEMIEVLRQEYDESSSYIDEDTNEELEFLKAFLQSFNITNHESIAYMDKQSFLLACLCLQRKEEFKSLRQKVEKLPNFSSVSNCDSFGKFVKKILFFKERGLLLDIANVPLKKVKKRNIEDMASIYQKGSFSYRPFTDESVFSDNSDVFYSFFESEEQRKLFFDLLTDSSYTDNMMAGLAVIFAMLAVIDQYQSLPNSRKKEFYAFLTEKFRAVNMYSLLKEIEERKNNLLANKRKKEKEKRGKEKKLNSIIKELREIENKENVRVSPTLLLLLKSEEMKFVVLQNVLFQNREAYFKTEKKLIQEDSLSTLEKLFKNYHFPFNHLSSREVELLTSLKDTAKIEKMLQILTCKHFRFLKRDFSSIGNIFLFSTPNKISTIGDLLLKGFLTEDFIKEHPDIFFDEVEEEFMDEMHIESGKYSFLLENLAFFKSIKIDIRSLVQNNPNLLIENPSSLKDIVSVLDRYHISYQKAKRFDLIENPDFIRFIDLFIELGLYDYIREHPDMINNNFTTIYRIILAKELGVDIFKEEKLHLIISGDYLKIGKTVITDDIVSEYIDNSTFTYFDEQLFKILEESPKEFSWDDHAEIEELLPFKKDDISYDIDGIIISRNKVLRNYHVLEDKDEIPRAKRIFNSLIYGSIFDYTTLEKLSNKFADYSLKKELKKG